MKGQGSYKAISDNLAIMQGLEGIDPNTRSDLSTNYLKYCVRKIVASLSDVGHIATYQSDAKQFAKQCEQQNKIVHVVYRESLFRKSLRKAMQWAIPTGVGYIWPKFKREKYGFGEGKIVFKALGLCDYIPVQVPDDNDVVNAYAGTIVDFMPIAEAHARFPLYQSSLFPVGKRRYTSQVAARRLDLAEMFRYGASSQSNWDGLYCEIRYTFIHDMSINTSGSKMPMGEPGTSWYYEVPSVGDEIPAPYLGQGKTRPATNDDCLIYPNLRLMISSFGMKEPMYDGPAFDWHGMIPLAQYCVDDWPWEGLGCSLISDVATVEKAKRSIERGMHQIADHRLDPGLAYDRSGGVNPATANELDPFEKRLRLGMDGDPEKIFRTFLPEHLLNVPEWEFKFRDLLKAMIEEGLGLNDIGNLANAKMNIQSDAAEKMLEVVGPLVKDISFGMECSTQRVGEMLKFIVPQFFDSARVMQYIGPDEVSEETFDFDPDKFIPSHMPWELEDPNIAIPSPSQYNLMERAKRFAKNLRLVSVPGRLHNITKIQDQLKWLQIGRSQIIPIAPQDLAKKMDIDNYGEIPGNTMFERAMNYKKMEIEMMAKAKELASVLMPQPPGQQPGTGPGGGQKGTGGRPPSGQKGPKVKQKGQAGGNPRTVVSESG